jgi:hypothetical protein
MIRRKKRITPPEPLHQQKEIIEYEGRRYYKLNKDEMIQQNALHRHYYGKRYNPIKHKKTIGMKPSDFIERNFYNPLPKTDIKKGKFKIENIYID